jgi:hypothetical protein
LGFISIEKEVTLSVTNDQLKLVPVQPTPAEQVLTVAPNRWEQGLVRMQVLTQLGPGFVLVLWMRVQLVLRFLLRAPSRYLKILSVFLDLIHLHRNLGIGQVKAGKEKG